MSQEYKVIKLKSGEELIAEISETTSDKIKLSKPMIFKTVVVPDINGNPKEGIVLKNWLAYGTQTETTIPSDFIATTLDPSLDVISYYLYEKERQNGAYVKTSIEDLPKEKDKDPKNIEDYEKMITKMFENIFKDLDEEIAEVKPKPTTSKKKNQPKNNKKQQHMIHMNLLFTPEVLAHMINNGLIDPRDIMDMIDHFKLNEKPKKRNKNKESINDKKYTGNEKDREDFGNKWTDWNPDPLSDDYK